MKILFHKFLIRALEHSIHSVAGKKLWFQTHFDIIQKFLMKIAKN